MEKRILADYRWQDYRAQAAQLDELAQAGWQLQSEGVLGLILQRRNRLSAIIG